jgi:RNA polymerase sigma-70 factor (ECF subfamily)
MDPRSPHPDPISLPAGFRACFVRHYPAVLRLSTQLMRDPGEAQDLAQEVFVSLSRQTLELDDAAVRAWLLRVTLNRGLNALRAHRRRVERERHAPEINGIDDAESLLERRRARDRVRTTLAALDPRAAKLLMLRQLGMSYAELAAIVDVAPSSVGTLLLRAQRAFAAIYDQRFGTTRAEGEP